MPPTASPTERARRRAGTAALSRQGSGDTASSKPSPGLYLVATPIGNLGDITVRALDLLGGVDAIACEDTRVTATLLRRHGLRTPLMPYHDHNADKVRPALLERLRRGEAIALVPDAGTPLVSDPGYKLVRACAAAGIAVTALPGPSAPLAALVLSGLPTDRFLFLGFLPPRRAARRAALAEVAGVRATLVVLESARRLPALLADAVSVLGSRQAAVARELTKLFEEVRRGPLGDLAAHYAAAGPPKGEVVVVLGPPEAAGEPDSEAIDRALVAALENMSLRDATSAVAAATGRPRRLVYERALALARAGRA